MDLYVVLGDRFFANQFLLALLAPEAEVLLQRLLSAPHANERYMQIQEGGGKDTVAEIDSAAEQSHDDTVSWFTEFRRSEKTGAHRLAEGERKQEWIPAEQRP